jgi:putative IMPACT (imprinted ancient) family translation regulator
VADYSRAVDHYITLAARAEARVKVERSEFLAICIPAPDIAGFMLELGAIEKTYFNASHHCWAYRPFAGPERSNDAGEPAGTAGKPIASALKGAGLHDAGVVVVRWFGGVKLGTGGLARAYRETAAAALHDAPTVHRYLYKRIEVLVPFERLSDVYRLIAPPDVVLAGEDFGSQNVFAFDVRASCADAFRKTLVEKRLTTLP